MTSPIGVKVKLGTGIQNSTVPVFVSNSSHEYIPHRRDYGSQVKANVNSHESR